MNLNWIITDMTVEFTPLVAGKSKPKMIAPKTQKSRHNAETPVMVSNQPDSVILDTVLGQEYNNIINIFSDQAYMQNLYSRLCFIKALIKDESKQEIQVLA